jgi:hypothetical protein
MKIPPKDLFRRISHNLAAAVLAALLCTITTSPTSANGSTKAAALWRTEALLQIAIGQAESGDLDSAEESLALAVEESAGVEVRKVGDAHGIGCGF